MNEYYEQLAHLHRLDVETVLRDMPDIPVPKTPDEIAFAGKFSYQEHDFLDLRPKLRPEPLLDLGLWWLHANVPQGDREVSFLQGDTGPGQFLYADGAITALIDWELAHVGDPMLDLGVGRMRNMLYPTCSLAGPLAHYEEAAGRPIDRAALCYYTVMSMLLTPLGTSISMQRMTARQPDMMPRFGWDVTLRRGLCDALAEDLAIEIEPPDLPEATSGLPTLVDYLRRKLPLVPKRTAFAWAHVDDIARGHMLAMEKGQPGRNYFICGPVHTLEEALDIARSITGIRPPRLRVGPSVLRAMAAGMAVVEKVVPLPPSYTSEGLRIVAGVTYLGSNARARNELGWRPRPLRDGLMETLRHEMRLLGMAPQF